MKRFVGFQTAAAVLSAACQIYAMNGVAAHIAWWNPFVEANVWSCDKYQRGKLVVARIANNQVTRTDTIFNVNKGIAQYPALDYSGTRIAFFRWGVVVKERADGLEYDVVTDSGKYYISIINIDGTGLRNLLQVSAPSACGGSMNGDDEEGNAVLDWPAGPWIYYEKPTKTTEIRRVNVNDGRDESVTSYGTDLRRWDLSWDAKWNAWQSRGSNVFNGANKFPSKSNQLFLTACNAAISCSGSFISHYYGGNHTLMCCTKIDPSTGQKVGDTAPLGDYNEHSVENIVSWWKSAGITDSLFKTGAGGADLIRWSVNSDKWVLRMIGWCGEAAQITWGSNQVAVNWKEKQAIDISKTKAPSLCQWSFQYTPPRHSQCADAGDLWVDLGGQAALGKYEAEDGTLKSITPTEGTLTYIPMLPPPASAVGFPEMKTGRSPIALMMRMNVLRTEFTDANHHTLILQDLNGRSIISGAGTRCIEIPKNRIMPGVYVIKIVTGNQKGEHVFRASIH